MHNPRLYTPKQNINNASFIMLWMFALPLITWGLALRMGVSPSGGLLTGVMLAEIARCLMERYYRQNRPNRQRLELIISLSVSMTLEWFYGLEGMEIVLLGYVGYHLFHYRMYIKDQSAVMPCYHHR